MSAPPFLASPELRLLLFGGKGGVGKTTCAVAAGLRLAHAAPTKSLQLFSTDPAHSLKDSLADLVPPASLQVVEFNAQEALDTFRRRYGPQLQAIAERGTFLDSEDIHRFLSLSLPGMDELFAFLEIARRAESAEGPACTIVDTAPTGHTLRLLGMPELLRRWLNVLDTLLAKHRYMKQLFRHAYQPDELDRFLNEQNEAVKAAEALLTDPARCRFVPVMVAEELSVRETGDLLDELTRLRIPAGDLIVNMLSPSSECPVCAGTREQQLRVLEQLPVVFQGRTLWGAPLHSREVKGARLDQFWDDVESLDPHAHREGHPAALPRPPQLVREPAELPRRSLQLLLVGGKGGVGKTTLACATAVRLAREWPQSRILLFSTDPANSVADCLDREIRSEPVPVFGGLKAMEIDAQAELDALKQQYRQEIDQFFGSMFRGLDVPFDREVMERIIELSPPGLDEIMALTRAMDFLTEQTCDLLVLDTAPTGHLLRLLELPELIEQWLKAFFEVFLKYREVFGLPEFSERLVKLSKDLHRFRSLLRDSARSALYVVSVPTRMALEETQDLLASCHRMHVSVPVLFLNMMTPESNCSFCAARVRLERELEREFQRSFPGQRTLVFRQPEPRGVERLGELGQALYRNHERGGERSGRATP